MESYLQQKKDFIDQCLDSLWDEYDHPAELHQAMKYSITAGGKRLRPILTMAASEVLGQPGEDLWEVACALELIHTYSLVHDDLPAMDDDELRRGKPTCHVVYGEAMAILAGDALLTKAFELLARYGESGDPHVTRELLVEVARAAGSQGMIGGQVLDLQGEGKNLTLEELNDMHSKKTGALIRAAVLSGAIAAGASPEQKESLGRFASLVGLAFQITDDLLNLAGDSEEMGKKTGTDWEKGKASYPLVEGEEKARKRLDQLYLDATRELEAFGEQGEILRLLAHRLVYREK